MNIAIITLVNSNTLTGLGKYIIYLIEHLQKLNSEQQYYIFVNREFEKLIRISNPNFHKVIVDIPHYPRLLMRPVYFFWQSFLAYRLYRKYKIDLVHIPNPVPFFYFGKIPHIFTIHDVAEFRVKRYSYFRQKLRKLALLSSKKRAKKIITVSDYSKSEIQNLLNVEGESIHVTKPASSIDKGSDNGDSISEPYILHIGGLQQNKNLDRVIEAWSSASLSNVKKLILVGTGDAKRVEFYKTKNIEWLGYVSDQELFSLYKNARALIYPSTYEGFGLPILEAMACGTPVITSNVTSMPEVGADAAHYVDPYDVDSIRRGIEKVLNDEEYRQELIEKGLKRFKEFDWMETARKTVKAYEKAVGNE